MDQEAMDSVVVESTFGSYTVAELTIAFELVENKDHWKNPVSIDVWHSALGLWEKKYGVTIDTIKAAIPFFQASEATVRRYKWGVRITSRGYLA